MEKNCPNCGAPYDLNLNKCAYCDTSYFDLSCIPLNEPFYLKLNLGTTENPRIIIQKVFTTGVSITNSPSYCLDVLNRPMFMTGGTTEYELSFTGLN